MKFSLIFGLLFSILFSQTKPIQGKVINEKSESLADVNIVSKPSGTGTKTNADGEFIFEIPVKDRVFIIKHIGYKFEKVNAIVFKNGSTITLTPKVIKLKQLDVTGISRAQFDTFETKNSVIILGTEDLAVRGFIDIGDVLFTEQSVLLDETLSGQKTVSIRGSSPAEMVYLYDGIRINSLGDPLFDLSLFSASGLSGLELVKGGHEKGLSSSGTINFIPKLTYGSNATFTQQFGTYNFGGYDGVGSFGKPRFSINGGAGETQFSQVYVDNKTPEIKTSIQRKFGHLGLKNKHNLEVRIMGFKNGKQFQNDRTNDTISTELETIIGRFIHSSPKGGAVSFFGLFQNSIGSETNTFSNILKDDSNQGFGFSFEKPIQNAMISFNGETSFLNSNWTQNDSTLIMSRQNSIFTGALELIKPDNNQIFQLKDVKIILSKQLVADQSDSSGDLFINASTWDESSTLFTGSFLNLQDDKRIMLYSNLGNVFRLPTLHERNSNRIHNIDSNSIELVPEHKTTFEVGIKIENKENPNLSSYNLSLSGFNYQYSNKIKQIQITGTPIQLPVNFGDASLSGFDSHFSVSSKTKWFNFTSSYAYYIFSDPLAFQLQPEKMVRNKVSFKIKWFQLDIIQRSESARQVTSINQDGEYLENKLEPINTNDMNLSFKLKRADFIGIISFSGKNLGNTSQELNGISIFDKRFALSLGLSWK